MYSLLQLNTKYIKEDEEIPLPAETVDGDLTLNEVQVIYLQCIQGVKRPIYSYKIL